MVRQGSPQVAGQGLPHVTEHSWHATLIERVLEILDTSVHGLSSGEAADRLKRFGPNILPAPPRPGSWAIFVRQLRSLFTVVLGISAIVSFALGDHVEGIVILSIVVLNVGLGFAQEYKAENSLEALRKIIHHEATVVRGGEPDRMPARNVVVGDIVLLASGERIPADARLIEIKNLEVNESVLTGESRPVAKVITPVDEGVSVADRRSMVYSGTHLTRGEGTAVVVATGADTEVGLIALAVRTTPDEETPLEERLGDLARYITFGVGALAVVMFLFGFAVLPDLPLHERFVMMFTTSVAVAVAAIPEGLIAAITVILTTGMMRLLDRKVLVRRLRAAETLGATTVLCVDKTGTVTEGTMRLAEIITPEQDDAVGRDEVLKASLLANESWAEEPPDGKGPHTAFRIIGDPTDGAILEAGFTAGMHALIDRREEICIDRLPFESQNQFSAVLARTEHGSFIYIKGAGETVIPGCVKIFAKGEEREISAHERGGGITRRHNDFSQKGFRVLAVARVKVPDETLTLPDPHAIINNLTFLGFVVLEDPLRKGVREALDEARRAGIKTVLITGDHVLTARKIAQDLGITRDHEATVISGADLAKISDEELAKRIGQVAVFARTHPRDKLRIVEALKRQGEVVAMTGDGINDAPAMKAAHIGVGLGSGSDVAKEAADMVVMDDNFATLVVAVREGRIIFDNIRKVVLFLMFDALSEVMLVFFSLLFGLPLPVLAVQILFVNLVEDSLPALALAFEPAEWDVMQRKPRKKDEPIFSREMLFQVLGIGTILNVLFVAVFAWLVHIPSVSLAEARTVIFASLGVTSFAAIFAIRGLRTSVWRMNPLKNIRLCLAVSVGFLALCAAVYVPFFHTFLHTASLQIRYWGIIGVLSLASLAGIEIVKFIARRVAARA